MAIGLHYLRGRACIKRMTFNNNHWSVLFKYIRLCWYTLITHLHKIIRVTCNLATFSNISYAALIMTYDFCYVLLIHEHAHSITVNGFSIKPLVLVLENLHYFTIVRLLIMLANDIHLNPEPYEDNGCFSIIHQNIRSIRNKLDFIKDNFVDNFDVIRCTETHLSQDILDSTLKLEGLGDMFRKDVSSHSGGIIVYCNSSLQPKRLLDLETILPESLCIKVKDHNKFVIIATVYRPPNSPPEFWHRCDLFIEQALEVSNNVIFLGDINEDQLNVSNRRLRDILVVNNMTNVITEPTRVTRNTSTLIDIIAH